MLGALIVGWFVRGYFPAYLAEKGKNLATREDIAEITQSIEQVKLTYASQLEATKTHLSQNLETLKHDLSLLADSSKRHEGLKASAYVDFCKAAAGLAIAQKWNNSEKELEALIAMTDAKARIAVYGSPEVASALGVFFKEYAHLSSPEAMSCFIAAMSKMRDQTVGASGSVPDSVLARLFFGDDLPAHKPGGHGSAHLAGSPPQLERKV